MVALAAGIGLWVWIFAGLALERHAAGGTHAEDLGFTDQVIWNFLQGQWFRTSLYQGATWNTEIDVASIRRPDSLLAFHVEPMLLLLVPLYALGGQVQHLVGLQAVGLALGAVPAYRLGVRWGGLRLAGLAVAAAYLLSPLGQWTALADFHTTALAAPLLLLAVERFAAGRPRQGVVAAVVAMSAREDVGLVVAALGAASVLGGRRRLGAVLILAGVAWVIFSFGVMRHYGGTASPFLSRYSALFEGPSAVIEAFSQPVVLDYAVRLLLGGGWLALLTPLAAAPALPALALNVLSSSPWMASGKAHYSALVLPFAIAGAAGGLGQLRRWTDSSQVLPARWLIRAASLVLVLTSLLGYVTSGAGPLAANHAPPTVTEHAWRAKALTESIPPDAAVSASASLVPHVSRRSGVYLFPAVEDAEYVLLDFAGSPAPTSAGDVYLRVEGLLTSGVWTVERAEDGLLLLRHEDGHSVGESLPPAFYTFTQPVVSLALDTDPMLAPTSRGSRHSALAAYLDGALDLLSAELLPSPTGAIEPGGPRGLLRTTWRANQPLPPSARPEFLFHMSDRRQVRVWDIAAVWWNPPERWPVGQPVQIDVPGVPLRGVAGWSASVRSTGSEAETIAP